MMESTALHVYYVTTDGTQEYFLEEEKKNPGRRWAERLSPSLPFAFNCFGWIRFPRHPEGKIHEHGIIRGHNQARRVTCNPGVCAQRLQGGLE